MKEFFKKVWKAIRKFFDKLDDATKMYVPIVINICEALKKAVANGTYDTVAALVEAVIPGNAEDPVIAGFKSYLSKNLPKIITSLQLVDIIAEIDGVDEQYLRILELMRAASGETQNAVYAEFSQMLLNYLADGKLSKSERVALIEYYYHNITKA
jgi:hypothetical protein